MQRRKGSSSFVDEIQRARSHTPRYIRGGCTRDNNAVASGQGVPGNKGGRRVLVWRNFSVVPRRSSARDKACKYEPASQLITLPRETEIQIRRRSTVDLMTVDVEGLKWILFFFFFGLEVSGWMGVIIV